MENNIENPTDNLPETYPLIMPVCPYCKTEMTPFDYRGYYDSFVGWECKCTEIPGAEKQAGQYA